MQVLPNTVAKGRRHRNPLAVSLKRRKRQAEKSTLCHQKAVLGRTPRGTLRRATGRNGIHKCIGIVVISQQDIALALLRKMLQLGTERHHPRDIAIGPDCHAPPPSYHNELTLKLSPINVGLVKTAANLFESPAQQEAFIEAVVKGESKEAAIIIVRDHPAIRTFPRLAPVSWQPDCVMRLGEGFRPAKHPLYEKGHFYSLDLSSVFCASAMLAIEAPVRRVWDVCASPGGKAIFAWVTKHPELLACNEIIRKRTGSLISNLHRCGIEGSLVWSSDPSVWAKKFPEAFDLITVDAPCSGQSLWAKGDEAPGSFSPSMVDMCVGRQRRIMANAAKALRPGGHLLYCTCTYSRKENENVIAWLLEQFEFLEAVPVPRLHEHESSYADFHAYRLFPHEGVGAGGFTCLLRHKGDVPEHWTSVEILTGSWRYGEEPVNVQAVPSTEMTPEPFRKPRGPRPSNKKVWKPRKPPEPKGRRGRKRP